MEVGMAEAHKRAYRHPKYKTSYRIKNWSEYEKFLDFWKVSDPGIAEVEDAKKRVAGLKSQ